MARRERVVYDDDDDPEPLVEFAELIELEKGLRIDEDALDEALLAQPDLFYRVSKALALLSSRRDAAKQEIGEAEAVADLQIRTAARRDQTKITNEQVASEKRLNKRVKRAIDQMLHLNSAVAQFGALKEAYQQRSWALKELCNLNAENYYSDRSYGGARNDALTRVAERNKRDMADARRNRR
jgi:hypothetical protein